MSLILFPMYMFSNELISRAEGIKIYISRLLGSRNRYLHIWQPLPPLLAPIHQLSYLHGPPSRQFTSCTSYTFALYTPRHHDIGYLLNQHFRYDFGSWGLWRSSLRRIVQFMLPNRRIDLLFVINPLFPVQTPRPSKMKSQKRPPTNSTLEKSPPSATPRYLVVYDRFKIDTRNFHGGLV